MVVWIKMVWSKATEWQIYFPTRYRFLSMRCFVSPFPPSRQFLSSLPSILTSIAFLLHVFSSYPSKNPLLCSDFITTHHLWLSFHFLFVIFHSVRAILQSSNTVCLLLCTVIQTLKKLQVTFIFSLKRLLLLWMNLCFSHLIMHPLSIKI